MHIARQGERGGAQNAQHTTIGTCVVQSLYQHCLFVHCRVNMHDRIYIYVIRVCICMALPTTVRA